MGSIFDPTALELQEMRIQITNLLRHSSLEEPAKKSLMITLPYLPISQLTPIFEKLKEERNLQQVHLSRLHIELHRIKREAWRKAESYTTPSKDQLDTQFSERIAQI